MVVALGHGDGVHQDASSDGSLVFAIPLRSGEGFQIPQ